MRAAAAALNSLVGFCTFCVPAQNCCVATVVPRSRERDATRDSVVNQLCGFPEIYFKTIADGELLRSAPLPLACFGSAREFGIVT
jgi:hypothetical protein